MNTSLDLNINPFKHVNEITQVQVSSSFFHTVYIFKGYPYWIFSSQFFDLSRFFLVLIYNCHVYICAKRIYHSVLNQKIKKFEGYSTRVEQKLQVKNEVVVSITFASGLLSSDLPSSKQVYLIRNFFFIILRMVLVFLSKS